MGEESSLGSEQRADSKGVIADRAGEGRDHRRLLCQARVDQNAQEGERRGLLVNGRSA